MWALILHDPVAWGSILGIGIWWLGALIMSWYRYNGGYGRILRLLIYS